MFCELRRFAFAGAARRVNEAMDGIGDSIRFCASFVREQIDLAGLLRARDGLRPPGDDGGKREETTDRKGRDIFLH